MSNTKNYLKEFLINKNLYYPEMDGVELYMKLMTIIASKKNNIPVEEQYILEQSDNLDIINSLSSDTVYEGVMNRWDIEKYYDIITSDEPELDNIQKLNEYIENQILLKKI